MLTTSTKRKTFLKVFSGAVALCMAAWVLVPGLSVNAAPVQDFNTVEGLAGNALGHYNGILFGDWTAMAADNEGAIAVAGNVNVPNDFSISANGDKKVMGDYDPTEYGYPTALFGAQSGVHSMYFGNVQAFGHIVLRASAKADFEAEMSKVGSASGIHYVDDAAIDGLFARARNATNTILDMFGSAATAAPISGDYLSQTWADYAYELADLAPYEVSIPALGSQKVAVIPVSGTDINWLTPMFGETFTDYDLVVFYFPDAQTVNYASGLTYYYNRIEHGVYNNGATHASGNTEGIANNVAWAERLVMVYPNATEINFQGSSSIGSIVAPNAIVDAKGGSHNGMLIADSLTQAGGFELHAYWISPYISRVVDEDEDPATGPATFVKVDKDSGKNLRDAEFALEMQVNGEWTPLRSGIVSAADGSIYIDNLLAGEYRLQETEAPEGYVLKGDYIYFTMYEEDGEVYQRDAKNNQIENELDAEPDPGPAHFTKVDRESGAAVPGAKFILEQLKENTWTQVRTDIVSGSDGGITVYGLLPGYYRLTEVEAPQGYVLDETPVYFNMYEQDGKTLQLDTGNTEIENEPVEEPDVIPGPARFTKVDGESGAAVGGARFTLAMLTESGWETLFSEIVSAPDGAIVFEDLYPGYYRLVETQAPEGYTLRTQPVYFNMYEQDGKTLQLDTGSTAIENEAEPEEPEPDAPVWFGKQDAETHEPLGGAHFDLYAEVFEPEASGDGVSDGSDADTLSTRVGPTAGPRMLSSRNDSGIALAGDPAETGPVAEPPADPDDGNNETGAPAYTGEDDSENEEPVDDIDDTEEVDELSPEGATGGGESTDEPDTEAAPEPGIKQDGDVVSGEGEEPVDSQEDPAGDLTDGNENEPAATDDWYDLIYEGRYWKLIEEDLVSDSTGSIYETDSTGGVTAYLLVETAAPEGYILPGEDERYTIIEYNGEPTLWVLLDNTAEEEPAPEPNPGEALFYKINSETLEGISGAGFRLEKWNEDSDNWDILQSGILSGENGRIAIGGLLPGYYRLVEETAPEGFMISNGPVYFTMYERDGDTLQEEQEDDQIVNQPEGPDEPEPDPGVALLWKIDASTSDGIPDAQFRLELWNEETDVWDILRDDILSTSEGQIEIGGLLPGYYRLIEEIAPDGYILDPTPKYFTMYAVGDETLQMDEDEDQIENMPEEPAIPEPVYGEIRITKCDFDDNDVLLPGTVFRLEKYTLEDTGPQGAALRTTAAKNNNDPTFLYDEENWAAYPDANSNIHTTGQDGVIVVTGLVAGIYRVEEIEAPNGYDLWGDGGDVIHFVMVETSDAEGNAILVVDSIYNNHLEVDGELMFANRPIPLVEEPDPSTSGPSTTTSTPAPFVESESSSTTSSSNAGSNASGASSSTGSYSARGGQRAASGNGATGTKGAGSTGSSAKGGKVQTGDETSVWTPVAAGVVAAVALVGLSALILARKRKL